MECCVPFCKNTDDNGSKSGWITFHEFPTELYLHNAWLKALGKQDGELPDSAVVCSQHFLKDDFVETKNGLRQIRTDAIPSTIQVCLICLETDSQLFLISKYKLETAYENLTGYSVSNLKNLKQTLCIECAQRLINFSKFRDKSLRARSLIKDLTKKHDLITIRHIKSINRVKNKLNSGMVKTILEPNRCDLNILKDLDNDQQTESDETEPRVVDTVIQKNGEISLLVGEDHTRIKSEIINEIRNSADNDNDELVGSKNCVSDNRIIIEPKLFKNAICENIVIKSERVTKPRDTIKLENFTFECKFCFETFLDEKECNRHTMIHLKQHGDYEFVVCGTESDNAPLLAANKSEPRSRSTSCGSSLITDDQRVQTSSDYPPAADGATVVVPLFTEHIIKDERSVDPTEQPEQIKDHVHEIDNDTLNKSTDNRKLETISDNVKKTKTIASKRDNSLMKRRKLIATNKSNSADSAYDARQNMLKQKSVSVKHSGASPYVCQICQFQCRYFTTLARHMNTHSIPKPFSVSCNLCDYKCGDQDSLASHMSVHKDEKPFACKLCDFTCAQSGQLLAHMRTHTGEKPFACKLCEYKCAQSGQLIRHMRTHTGEKPVSCNICDYKCAQSSQLAKHMPTHSGNKPFSCVLCEYQSASKYALICHMRVHTGEKPYSCKLCDYKCAQSCGLITHMRIHTGEKPFRCKLCEYQCARKSSLDRHIRTHTGEKPFSCNLCEFRCSRSALLVRHMRTHTGEKPFSCKVCEYQSAYKGALVRHMRIHAEPKGLPE